jgi:hypothetical protein
LLKCFAAVDDFVRDIQALSDELGNANLATATLLPPLRGGYLFILMFPNLEGDTMNIISLAPQERSGDGAIDSAAHPKQHCWTCHKWFRDKA